MFKSVSVIFVVFFVQGALSLFEFDGQCPQTKALDTFIKEDFMGRWNAYAKFPEVTTNEDPFVQDRTCAYANYANPEVDNITIDGHAIVTETGDEVSRIWDGTLVAPGQISLLNAPPQSYRKLEILDTDYKNYACLYSCIPLSENKYKVEAWIVTRSANLSEEFLIKAVQPLRNMKLNVGFLVPFRQTVCPAV